MEPYFRQQEILPPADLEGIDIDIVGAGSLGGAILICVCKMGFGVRNRITVTDFDHCEEQNLATQWFRSSHVALEQPKVDALAEMVALTGETEIVAVRERFSGAEPRPLGPVVVLAVDSLEERRGIWRSLAKRDDVRFLVDARMGAEVLEIHSLDLRREGGGASSTHRVTYNRPWPRG